MAILFISDLHLEDRRPEMTAQLLALLQGEAREAEALYILGDLFEFWIGDDVLSPTAERVADGLKTLSGTGVPCYFMHGNRDFLIGPDYAERAGLQLLPETVELDLYGDPTLLLHGDTLCTDDVAYQAFRQQVRNPAWQQAFL
jgi:UDP-2,3-diacylglucosamine hydrolase